MVKWRCMLCESKQQSEVKPQLGQRLCKECMVGHYERLVAIYKPGGGFRFEEAKLHLKAAKAELKAAKKEVKA
jgi:hypothetical protein